MLSLSRFSRALVAIAVAVTVAACSRNDPASFIASAKSYMAKSDYKAAIVQLKNAVAGAPNDPETRFLLARALLETGDVVGAEAEVRKAIDLKYSPEETYPLLARSLVGQGKYDAAIAAVAAQKLETAQARADIGTTVAVARSAPTVHSSRGRTANGSKRKWRIALRCVILSTSSSGTPSSYFMRYSGDVGHVESECG